MDSSSIYSNTPSVFNLDEKLVEIYATETLLSQKLQLPAIFQKLHKLDNTRLLPGSLATEQQGHFNTLCMRYRDLKPISSGGNFQRLSNTVGYLRFAKNVDLANHNNNDGHVVSRQWIDYLWQSTVSEKVQHYIDRSRVKKSKKEARIKAARQQVRNLSVHHHESTRLMTT